MAKKIAASPSTPQAVSQTPPATPQTAARAPPATPQTATKASSSTPQTATKASPPTPSVAPATVVVQECAPPKPAEHRPRRNGFKTVKYAVLLIAVYHVVFASGLYEWYKQSTNSLVWHTSPPAAVGLYMNASAVTSDRTVKKMVYPRPERQPGQILVKVEKASGNPVDFKMRDNAFYPHKSFPFISGYDFAGRVVEEDGAGGKFKLGQRVFGMLPAASQRWGTFAEYVAVDEEFVASVPDNVSMEQAAAIPLASLTAMQILAQIGPVVEGERILIHAGSGGVGTFAVQFAKHLLKLNVYTTSSNVELCLALGADRVINYRTENFADFGPFDYVIDSIGGEYLLRGLRKCSKHYLSVLNSGWEEYFGNPVMIAVGELASNVVINALHYVTLGRFFPKYTLGVVRSNGKQLQLIADLVAQGTIKVIVDKPQGEEELVGLDLAPLQVLQRLKAGRTKGKIVLTI